MNKHAKLLVWIERSELGMILESQIVGSGMSKTLNDLLIARKVDIVAHPTVRDGNAPATAVILRRSALAQKGRP